MGLVWSHARNEQRPAVVRSMHDLIPKGLRVFDVGAGDAYYLKALKPSFYLAVEPNNGLRKIAKENAEALGIDAVFVAKVSDVLSRIGEFEIDLLCMVHSFLYLSPEERRCLLNAVSWDSAYIVNPSVIRAVTYEFEDEIGIACSRRAMRFLCENMRAPLSEETVQTNFYVDSNTSVEELAVLIAHLHLGAADSSMMVSHAKRFVEIRLNDWRQSGCIRIPQWQTIAMY